MGVKDLPPAEAKMPNRAGLPRRSMRGGIVPIWVKGFRILVDAFVSAHGMGVGKDSGTNDGVVVIIPA